MKQSLAGRGRYSALHDRCVRVVVPDPLPEVDPGAPGKPEKHRFHVTVQLCMSTLILVFPVCFPPCVSDLRSLDQLLPLCVCVCVCVCVFVCVYVCVYVCV